MAVSRSRRKNLQPRVRILAVFSSHHTFARLADGAVALRDRTGVAVVLQPVSSFQDLAKDATDEGKAIVTTDLPSPSRSRPGALSRRMASLRLLRNEHPDLPVVTFVERWDSGLVPTLRGLPIREVGRPGEEHVGRALPTVLAEEVLPQFAVEFLRAVPDRLQPGHRLALARGVMRPGATWGEEDLARWAGVDVDRLRADFRRAGASSPEEWRLWAHLYQVAERMERDGKALEGVACGLAIPDAAAFLHDCRPLVGGDPTTVLRRGGPSEVLRRLRRWYRRGGPRPGRTDGVVGTGKDPAGEGATAPALPGSSLEEDRAARVEELFREFSDDVRQGAKARGASDEDAYDTVQDVFVNLLERGSDLREREFSRAYFWRSGWNRAAKLSRKATVRTRSLSKSSPHGWSAVGSAEPERHGLGRQDVLRDVIRRLPEPQRTVVRLCDLERWKVREVAELLDTTEKSVEHRRAQARRRIESDLECWPATRRGTVTPLLKG